MIINKYNLLNNNTNYNTCFYYIYVFIFYYNYIYFINHIITMAILSYNFLQFNLYDKFKLL